MSKCVQRAPELILVPGRILICTTPVYNFTESPWFKEPDDDVMIGTILNLTCSLILD
jgi:hypothetical protein